MSAASKTEFARHSTWPRTAGPGRGRRAPSSPLSSDAAVDNFTKAIALNPEFDVAALHRATLCADVGRVKDGIRQALDVAKNGGPGARAARAELSPVVRRGGGQFHESDRVES